jgi:hypothetical protein
MYDCFYLEREIILLISVIDGLGLYMVIELFGLDNKNNGI